MTGKVRKGDYVDNVGWTYGHDIHITKEYNRKRQLKASLNTKQYNGQEGYQNHILLE